MRYIRALQGHTGRSIVYAFLSNGQDWCCCANFGSGQDIARCEIKLFDIIQNEYSQDTAQALALFIKLFGMDYHQSGEAEKDGKDNENYINLVKENVRYIVTGLPFENIGLNLFNYIKKQNPSDFEPDETCLKEIYHDAITLSFRLIFQAYIEAKHPQLLTKHPSYKNYSLSHFHQSKMGWAKLRKNFQTLDSGDPADYMPVFNGGLFANKNTHRLDAEDLFSDTQIQEIVEQFLFKQFEDEKPIPIDYASLQIKHFSEIYEELLQFEFRIAQDKIYYIPDQKIALNKEDKKNKIDLNNIFADCTEYARLKTDYPDLTTQEISKGSLYFTNKTTNRKKTASYYTPESLTEFMCCTSIKEALQRCRAGGRSVLDLKILDNACGSGHFLTQALDVLFEEVQKQKLLENDEKLKQQIEKDAKTAQKVVNNIRYEQTITPEMVLKRLLLKHCIYGVDMNSFAVEIARASLWLDTFIFGIPLPFIEHHILEGNSLLGQIHQDMEEGSGILFIGGYFSEIQGAFDDINNKSDMTGEQAKQSHKLYDSIKDNLLKESLNSSKHIYGSFTKKFNKELKKKNCTIREQDPFVQDIEHFTQWFKPFHYCVFFPELWDFEHKQFKGFDLVIGNPPWDKIQFEEPEFFAQYHSNYRTLNDAEKKDVRQRVLTMKGIQEHYDLNRSFIDSQRLLYPLYFSLAHGSGGHQNLFRYFIERNLSLLDPKGLLCYLTPSAWSYELSSLKLRRHIWQHYHTHYFIQFENKGIFKNIDDRYKFACFMLSKADHKQKTIPALFLQHDEFILQRLWDEGLEALTLAYPVSLIQKTEGQTLLELKDQKDLQIIEKIQINPLLKTQLTQNYLHFCIDFGMTSDVAANIGTHFFDSPAELKSPRQLVEAKYFHQFNLNHQTKDFNHHPRYYDTEQIKTHPKMKKRIKAQGYHDADYPRLAWRWVASNTNERTAIFCLLPKNSLAGHTVWISTGKYPLEKLLLIQGIANSLVLDYLARQIVDIHMTKTIVDTLLFPQPEPGDILDSPLYREAVHLSALLSLGYVHKTSKQQEMDFVRDFLLEHQFYASEEALNQAIPETAEKRWQAQAKLDILVARDIYQLTLEDMKYIISAYFPQWKKEHAYHVNLVESLWDA